MDLKNNILIAYKLYYQYQGNYFLIPNNQRYSYRGPDVSFEDFIINISSLSGLSVRPSFLVLRYINNLKEIMKNEKIL